MSKAHIDSIAIHEWYDAPLIATITSRDKWLYANCIDYDFERRQREYALVDISEAEATEIAEVFARADRAAAHSEYCKRFAGRLIHKTRDDLEVGALIRLSEQTVRFDTVSRFFRFPVIDLLTND